ncbi:uncharacterized protein LOC116616704 [Nematostella vectensis]|uniref:uncharacterized protein LOC116616704 n=1 Tax=Nematostella vectensis TaxID=45351 RepID=UPI0020775046|nr:uncharacterized protein LOC116616704 [Nematostella vectensis]
MADPGKRGAPKKRCHSCNGSNALAQRVCTTCKAPFPPPKKKEMRGDGNITHQRGHLFDRTDVLQKEHGVDVVVLMFGRHGEGTTTSCYGTRGRGLKFIGDQQEAKPDEDGQLAFRLFDRFMRAQRKTPAATTPPTGAPAATTPPTAAPAATTPPTAAPAATTPPTGAPAATTPPTGAPAATTPT